METLPFEQTLKNRGKYYNGFRVNARYFGSYCYDALAIALNSFYHSSSFMSAVSKAINYRGDADTTGAITGQLAGAFYGYTSIDERAIKVLYTWDRGEIAQKGEALAKAAI